ncbi:hypothetical protein CP10139811_0151 [Chlamydia ibidis]|uniref:Uncharacterized protein n=2 Tax=Chlamydia ibidis TaxID=1405396 RepID=S7KFX7_9CHLA|nr:hypothetical protein [Chlamydia ibidis]EPP35091.1 hypothetical protein CP10139811_0151 [Chlamydia ibidis]EQM62798.1 hypothetical protein H359_0594 [Chlamydia ibidis 10-1398/6]
MEELTEKNIETSAEENSKTNVSFPTFVRFNLESQGLSEENKKKAISVTGSISSENTVVTNLTISAGGLKCNQDLMVGGSITSKCSIGDTNNFYGRVNLSNHTVTYSKTTANAPYNIKVNKNVNYTEITTKQNQQYVPYGYYKLASPKTSMYSALSGGDVGSGDAGGRDWWFPWDRFGCQTAQNINVSSCGGVNLNPNNCVNITGQWKNQLAFTASSTEPKLFRVGLCLEKHGGWLDNGTGGECVLYAKTNSGVVKRLQGTTCAGTSYYRSRPMQLLASTYYATESGFFYFASLQYSFRVASFAWNVVQLPFCDF